MNSRSILRAMQLASRTWLVMATAVVGAEAAASALQVNEITGTVTTYTGAAISDAKISIVSARSAADEAAGRAATEGRQAITDGTGAYKFTGLPTGAELTLSVEAEGYYSRLRRVTLDASRRVSFTLPARSAVPDGSQHQFAGQILRPDRTPAAGAVISLQKDDARALRARNRVVAGAFPLGAFDDPQDFEPWAKTDDDGKFFILLAAPATELVVTVDAKDVARGQSFHLWRGQKPTVCQLIEGSTIRGRVLKDAHGAEGVNVALALASPAGVARAALDATTDGNGRFLIEHVPPERGAIVFTRMNSLAERNLAAIKQEVYTGRDGQIVEMAEMNLHPAHHVRGRITFSERPPVAPQVDVVLLRTSVADSQRVRTDDRGEFVLRGVPSESVALSFQEYDMPGVVGYRLSARHRSLDPTRKTTLRGRVDEDLDLVVLFEPGEAPAPRPQPTVNGQLVRVVVQQPGGVRQIVQMPAAQLQHVVIFNDLNSLPLRGVEGENVKP